MVKSECEAIYHFNIDNNENVNLRYIDKQQIDISNFVNQWTKVDVDQFNFSNIHNITGGVLYINVKQFNISIINNILK